MVCDEALARAIINLSCTYIDTAATMQSHAYRVGNFWMENAPVLVSGRVSDLPSIGPVRKAPSSLFTMAVSPGTVALVACSLLPSLGIG